MKYIAYWIEYQKRELGRSIDDPDDGKPTWYVEHGTPPGGESEFRDRKPLWRR